MRALVKMLVASLLLLGCETDNTSSDSCGDGVIDVGEECDGQSFDGQDCFSLGYYGGSISCSETCHIVTTECTGGSCGDGVIQAPQEQCDGDHFGGETCGSMGFDGGALVCTGVCEIDDSGCYICGDDVKDETEECDGDDLGGETCESLGYYYGNLACNSDCTQDLTECIAAGYCGDGTGQENEECGADVETPDTLPCEQVDPTFFPSGDAVCVDCRWDLSACTRCGDGTIDEQEECDGTNLAGMQCDSWGIFTGGTLSCSDTCMFDTSLCTETCNMTGQYDACNPLATDPRECCSHNGQPADCVNETTLDEPLCLQQCAATADCGYLFDCSSTDGAHCMRAECGPAVDGVQPYGSCSYADGTSGTCLPSFLAMDEKGYCFPQGQLPPASACQELLLGEATVDASEQCAGGVCDNGLCRIVCNPLGSDTCPGLYNCLNTSRFTLDSTDPFYGLRTADSGICWASGSGNSYGDTPAITCNVLTQEPTSIGVSCPAGQSCQPLPGGASLTGICLAMESSPKGDGAACDDNATNQDCAAGLLCMVDDPYNTPSSSTHVCQRICDADTEVGNPVCAGLTDGFGNPYTCYSFSRFYGADSALPVSNQGDIETSPSRLGICVPPRQ